MITPPRVEASLSTRLNVWFQSIPLVTKSVLSLCLLLSLAALITGFDLAHPSCLSAQLVVERLQIYRVFSAAFVHSGVLHVAFNMFAFVPMASSLERTLGSVQFAYFVLLFMLLGDVFYIVCAYASDWLLHLGRTACAVGLSGVIFALVVVETHLSGAQQRSIFGFFNVPTPYFPWALLLLWQLLLPHVSFFGHLGGILGGQLYAWGWLARWTPDSSVFQAVERAFPVRLCAPLTSFISHTGGPGLPTSVDASLAGPFAPEATGRRSWFGHALRGWLPVATAEPPLSQQAPRAEAAEGRSSEPAKPEGRAYLLGGPSSQQSPPQVAPKLAAAAAAEARAAKGGMPQKGSSGGN